MPLSHFGIPKSGLEVPILLEWHAEVTKKLPSTIKDECRKESKAPRYVLVEVAKQRESDKMLSLYRKYKESGRTIGEIRNKERAGGEKPPAAAISFTATYLKKLDGLELKDLDQAQLTQLAEDLGKVQSAAQEKLAMVKAILVLERT